MHELVTASQLVFVSLTEDSLVQFSSFRDRDVKVSSFVSRYSSSFFFMFRVQLREGRGLLDLCSRDLFATAQINVAEGCQTLHIAAGRCRVSRVASDFSVVTEMESVLLC